MERPFFTVPAPHPTVPLLLSEPGVEPVTQVRITALFTNMRILKFKSQLAIALFAAVNHLNGPLRKQNFPLTGSIGHGF